jgi:hypothetical protein
MPASDCQGEPGHRAVRGVSPCLVSSRSRTPAGGRGSPDRSGTRSGRAEEAMGGRAFLGPRRQWMAFQYQSAVKICGSKDLIVLGGQNEDLTQSELVGQHSYAVRLLLRKGDRVGRGPLRHDCRRHRPCGAGLTSTSALPELVGLLVPASDLTELPSANQGSQRVVDRVLVVLFPFRSCDPLGQLRSRERDRSRCFLKFLQDPFAGAPGHRGRCPSRHGSSHRLVHVRLSVWPDKLCVRP